ncbi:MAG: hypothetical protein D6806_17095 [Deltaproteobacteria bacterium]|nr:MAG: hypothetical protein D6806_17095 [Deltaproteobacteria bacterium]
MRRTMVLALAAIVALSAGCGGNHAPRLLPLQNRTVETGNVLEFMVEAVDDDGDRLEFAAQGLPSGASFDQVDNNSAVSSGLRLRRTPALRARESSTRSRSSSRTAMPRTARR